MDLLFSKYASPFLFLDTAICNGRFFDSVIGLLEAENEKMIWEFFLHKVQDKSYEEFKESLETQKPVPKEQLETTVKDSKNILNNFTPSEK